MGLISPSIPARLLPTQQTHYLRKSVAFNTPGVGASDTVKIGRLPAGAFISGVWARIETPFNAGTTNVLTVGTSAGGDADIINGAADLNAGSAGTTSVTRGLGLPIANDTDIFVKFTQTGTPATAGAATIVISYAANNDG
ncbi:MAG TPA: hypothetical protein VHN11_17075 [Xanthobacteraceae bacterium]|jgi:hypothetical protein|nr:hypothetical protein [Xanthobacteraceae bacterium]